MVSFKRRWKGWILAGGGCVSLALAGLALVTLFSHIITESLPAFQASTFDSAAAKALIIGHSKANSANSDTTDIALTDTAFRLSALLPPVMQADEAAKSANLRVVFDLFSLEGQDLLQQNPDSWPVGLLMKSNIVHREERLSPSQKQVLDYWRAGGWIHQTWNTNFWTQNDSRETELAGIFGAILGTLWSMGICFVIAMPVGVGAGIWLVEFAPHSGFGRALGGTLELLVRNLAAVPSIIYGLLGLSLYINLLHLPRASCMVAGLVLAMLALPLIVVATMNALALVPASIRAGAMALGASRWQTTWLYVLPLASSGIITGAILSFSQTLGQTAPLLMIGMVAFIAGTPSSVTSPATVLPVQIYLWATQPERGFAALSAAAILVLLGGVLLLNIFAAVLRYYTERFRQKLNH